jgi:hypothetical protein
MTVRAGIKRRRYCRRAKCAERRYGGEKGYDAGKKVSGIKRHIAAGIMGLPHALAITTADVTDRQGAVEMTGQNVKNLPEVRK